MKIARIFGLLLIISSLLLIQVGCTKNRGEKEFRVGLLAVSSGELFRKGGYVSRGASLAVEKVNAQGGLKVGDSRVKIRLIFADSGGNPEMTSKAVKRLIDREHVKAIIGPVFSPGAISAAKVCELKKIPLISPSAGTSRLTPFKYAFRVSYTTKVQSESLAAFTVQTLKKAPVAILFAKENAYSSEMAKSFRSDYEKRGGSIAAFIPYTSGEREFFKQMKIIANSKAEILFLPGNTKKVQIQAAQARMAGFKGILLGSDSWDPVELAGNPVFVDSYFTDHWRPGLPIKESIAFEKSFYKKNSTLPTELEALSYDALMSLCAAVEYCNSLDSIDIRNALSEMPLYKGVTGKFDYNDNGDPKKDVIFSQIKANGTVESQVMYLN